jgi:hypothetical protein
LSQGLDKEVQVTCSQVPCNCRHNYRHKLDVKKSCVSLGMTALESNKNYNKLSVENLSTEDIGLCLAGSENAEQWAGTICEDEIDAQRCSNFSLRQTKNEVARKFEAQIKDLEWVKSNLPEIHALLWVLGSGIVHKLPWWKTLWFRFLWFCDSTR